MFPSWLSGAVVVLRSAVRVPSVVQFLHEIDRSQVTVVNLPTPYWHEWVHVLAATDLQWPSSLRLVVIGSERASPEALAIWRKRLGDRVTLVNAYGLTEVTITVLCCRLASDCPSWKPYPEVSIGRPIDNTQVYVLDRLLQPVPFGVAGELYIGGAGLARGYLNRPELTAERFIPNPFSEEPGARLYKTDDIVRFRWDRELEFLGRYDNQVKLRGFRIDLGEVEAVLRRHSVVQEAVVLARDNAALGKHLVAYIIPQQDQAVTTHDLRRFVHNQLPEYMVPSAYMLLKSLPVSENGKVDRSALPIPIHFGEAQEQNFVAPRTPIEEALAAIWAEVLGVEQVGVYDHFFVELGGHSLLATRLISHIRDAFSIELPLRCLFEKPTVADLAVAIVQTRAAQIDTERLARTVTEIEQLSEQEVQEMLGRQPR